MKFKTAVRKKMEKEFLRTSRRESIATFSGGIAHDFNNFLTVILNSIALVREKISGRDQEVSRFLSEAEKACLLAQKLTRQLMNFSRHGALSLKISSIADVLTDICSFAVRGSKVRCSYFLPKDLWNVKIDEGQITQVIHNLLINAIQAMPCGGEIRVCAENKVVIPEDNLPVKEGNYVLIKIIDQGCGIPEDEIHKIFKPYYTTKENGNGLGLANCKSIIENHGGHIGVKSKPGNGCEFFIYLPVSQEETFKEKPVQKRVTTGFGKILFMDDEQMLRQVVSDMLTLVGYEVTCAKDGNEAVDVYVKAKQKGRKFDAVILDLTIPGGMGGVETISKLKEVDPDVKAILSSGYVSDDSANEFRQYGFKGIVGKPFGMDEINDIICKTINENYC